MKIVKVSKNTDFLYFSYFESSKSITNFINSNNIYNNELLYTFSYALKNRNVIYDAICKMVIDDDVNTFKFANNDIANVFIPIFSNILIDVNIIIDNNASINHEIYQKMLKIKKLKSIKCYFMPGNYVRNFGKRGVSVYFTFNGTFSQNFVILNELKDMKNIYYKRNVSVTLNTLDDFRLFLTINKHLNIIHIYDYEEGLVSSILDIIGENKYMILIHQSDENINLISKDLKNLKAFNKEYKKRTRGDVKIVYSDQFVKDNIFKALTYSNIKMCSVIIIYLAFVLLISNTYKDYVTWFNSNVIMNSISTNETISNDILVEYEEESIVDEVAPEVEEDKDVDPYAGIPTEFEKLVSINEDTVGWVSVNNTKINYPVVQAYDNDYYLNRDFYKRRTSNGWVFMDYRNNSKELSQNTIIYAHSLLSGYMFGDLYKTLRSSWYKNEDNLVLTFNTIDSEMKWEVFSIYRTPYTTDYLQVNFIDGEDFLEFTDSIKERSVYNFGVKIEESDYIITLSTCVGNDNDRMVMHAKLVKE